MRSNATKAYGTQQVMTSSPAMLVALLYDKAIACLKEAVAAIEAGEVERRWKANQRACEIIDHLAATLDLEAGGEIAANLDQLYNFMLKRLGDVDLKNDPSPAREVIQLLIPLRDSWKTIAAGQTAKTDAAAPVQAASSKATTAIPQQPTAPGRPLNLSA